MPYFERDEWAGYFPDEETFELWIYAIENEPFEEAFDWLRELFAGDA